MNSRRGTASFRASNNRLLLLNERPAAKMPSGSTIAKLLEEIFAGKMAIQGTVVLKLHAINTLGIKKRFLTQMPIPGATVGRITYGSMSLKKHCPVIQTPDAPRRPAVRQWFSTRQVGKQTWGLLGQKNLPIFAKRCNRRTYKLVGQNSSATST